MLVLLCLMSQSLEKRNEYLIHNYMYSHAQKLKVQILVYLYCSQLLTRAAFWKRAHRNVNVSDCSEMISTVIHMVSKRTHLCIFFVLHRICRLCTLLLLWWWTKELGSPRQSMDRACPLVPQVRIHSHVQRAHVCGDCAEKEQKQGKRK